MPVSLLVHAVAVRNNSGQAEVAIP